MELSFMGTNLVPSIAIPCKYKNWLFKLSYCSYTKGRYRKIISKTLADTSHFESFLAPNKMKKEWTKKINKLGGKWKVKMANI